MGSRQQMLIWVAIAALVALVAAIAAVQISGQRNPSPPSLADKPRPEIPGELLYIDRDACISRVSASGGPSEQVHCGQPAGITGPYSIAWIDANTIAFSADRLQPNPVPMVEFDLDTKVETPTQRNVSTLAGAGAIEPLSVRGDRATIIGGELVVTRDGDRQVVATLDLEGYSARPILWSPDGEWIIVLAGEEGAYEDLELWVFSKDGATSGTLVTGISRPVLSWRIDGIGVSPVVVE